jgi:DNA-binding PadR family transcriptional regulator
MLELAILGLLKDQPLHGYELKKRLGESLGVLWGVSYGSLYPALRRLEKSGAIEVADPVDAAPPSGTRASGGGVPSTGSLTGDLAVARNRLRGLATPGRRTRKAYRITPKGDVFFAQLLLDDDAGDDERGFALRLSFFRHLSVGDRLVLLERRRADLSVRLDKARRRAPDGLDRYTRSLAEHRTRSIARDLEWVDELITAEKSSAHEEGATA